MHSIKIRRAVIEDANALTELSITTFLDTFLKDNKKEDMDKYIAGEMSISKLTDELNEPDNVFFLAYLDELLIGYAKLRTAKKLKELEGQNAIELERIYVLKQYHDAKAGATIMSHCISYAIAHHHHVMWLGVWEFNHRAVNFYKKWGFEFFGSHQFILGDDIQTDMLMKKELSA